MMVSTEEKRWIVVGVAMQVAAPVLRNCIKQGMDNHYTNLDAYCSHLTTPCTLKTLTYHQVNADPTLKYLKFQNVNNNHVHGKNKSLYTYSINSSVDLAKLYLPDYLAQFSAFDDSLDMTAILRLLGFNNYKPVAIFSLLTQTSADDVRENVRNKWGHFDNSEWSEAFFNDCFDKLQTLVQSMGLTAGVEKSTLDQLNDWQTKGCQLCMGHAVDQNLLSLIQQDMKELIKKYKKTETEQTSIQASLTEQRKEQIEIQTTVATLQDQQSSTRVHLEEHDEQLEAVKQWQKQQMKENKEILERLVSVEKTLSEELLIRVKGVEEDLAGVKTRVELLEEDNRPDLLFRQLEQLGQEVKRWKMEDVVPGPFSPMPGASRSNAPGAGSGASGSSKQVHYDQEAYPVKPFDVKTCRSKLAEHYKRTAKVPTSVWSSVCQVKLDQIYTRLSWVKKEQTPTGSSESKLAHYSDLFKADANSVVPKRILVQGQTGIGKSTFVKKLMVDWAQLDDEKTGDEQAATLKTFENNEGGEDVSEACNKIGIQENQGMLGEDDEWTSSDDEDTSSEDEDTSSEDEDTFSEDEGTSSEDDECTSHEKRENTNGNRSDVLRKFELVLVVTLKEVSSCQTLREVISRSRLFPKDEELSMDDLLSYVRNNQEKVLLVFDGFDEYRTGSTAEAMFGSISNSPICEIFHRNYLRDCTVLVTSRSSRADELQGSADKHAEITGFGKYDQVVFMVKMLDSRKQAMNLFSFLMKKKMLVLTRVPLLNLFFCLLWKQGKQKLMELIKTKTKLYQAIIRHILQYGHKKHSPVRVSKVNEENYDEILNEIGKVALESLLKGSQVFEYGQLSENVRGERSLIVGLLQLSEYEASLEPMEMVSFIHKSIQEYLAAWYITSKCVSADNLGGIEDHTCTLEDCVALENVFQFICGLSSEGALKVSKHLSTVRVSDPTLDLSKIIPDEESETYVPLCDVTERHERFNDLVLKFFREASSDAEHIKHWFDCTGGIILLSRPLGPKLLPKPEVFIQAAHSWAFLFQVTENTPSDSQVNSLSKSVQFLNLCHIPLRITESSEVLKLGDVLTQFEEIQCMGCRFCSILCCRDGHIQCYITSLTIMCDGHYRMLTEAAATISVQSLSVNLCSNQSCLQFLTSLNCFNYWNCELIKDLVAMIRNFKYLQRIGLTGSSDCACDVLEQVTNPGPCYLEIGHPKDIQGSCIITSAGTERFAALLLKFPNISVLVLDLRDCFAEAVTTLVTSITHKTLEKLCLTNISFIPASAVALGRVLPELTSLWDLTLTGKDGSILHAEEMEALFGGFNKALCLKELNFMHFSVSDNLGPLMKSLRFFPNLKSLTLIELNMDGDGLCLLLDSFRFISNVHSLLLSDNPLGHAVTSIVPHLTNLPKLSSLSIRNTGCSEEDYYYVRKAAENVSGCVTFGDCFLDELDIEWLIQQLSTDSCSV